MGDDVRNPYEPAISVTEVERAGGTSTDSDTGLQPKRSLVQHCLSAIVVVAFLSLGYFAVLRFLERQWLAAFLAASASLMCIPLVDHASPVRERIAASLVAPFAVGGLACFVLLYFQMFQFSWFENIFNDKGSGPFGLILSAVIGRAAGCLLGWQVVKRVAGVNRGTGDLSSSA